MPNREKRSSSPNPVPPTGGNSTAGMKQPTQKKDTGDSYPHDGYVLEDFSQQRINRGQQEINKWVSTADKQIVAVLKQLSAAVGKLMTNNAELVPMNNAITELSVTIDKIAGEFPPGCGDPGTRPPQY